MAFTTVPAMLNPRVELAGEEGGAIWAETGATLVNRNNEVIQNDRLGRVVFIRYRSLSL